MPSLMVIILALEVASELINTVGAATINRAAWALLNTLPTNLSREYAEQRKLQQEYLKCRGELNATSSQDEFAKWAKLRRQHDKLLEQLEKKKAALDSKKTAFDRYVTSVRWIATQGLRYFLPFWYAKVPMFWLPYGFFPYYAEWIISFPRAPIGSVSIVSWQLACTGFIVLLRDALTALLSLILQSRTKQTERKKRVSPMPASGGRASEKGADKEEGKPTTAAEREAKKEL